MITAELRVNCGFIGHIYCVNIGGNDGDWCDYKYEYYQPDETIVTGRVKHYQPNGAIALMKEICEDIETQGGK